MIISVGTCGIIGTGLFEMAGPNAKGRKIGRNQKWCQVYRAIGRRRINKMVRLDRHLRRLPQDRQAKAVRAAL